MFPRDDSFTTLFFDRFKFSFNDSFITLFFDKFRNLLDDYIVDYRIKYLFYFLFVYFFVFEFIEMFFSFMEFLNVYVPYAFNSNASVEMIGWNEHLLFLSYIADLSNIFYSNDVLGYIFGIGHYVVGFFGFLIEEDISFFIAFLYFLYLCVCPNVFAHLFEIIKNHRVVFITAISVSFFFCYLSFCLGLPIHFSYSLFFFIYGLFFVLFEPWDSDAWGMFGERDYYEKIPNYSIPTFFADLGLLLLYFVLTAIFSYFFIVNYGYYFLLVIFKFYFYEDFYLAYVVGYNRRMRRVHHIFNVAVLMYFLFCVKAMIFIIFCL